MTLPFIIVGIVLLAVTLVTLAYQGITRVAQSMTRGR